MNAEGSQSALSHVVAVMFENRSFDNLLGRLYGLGEVASFEGVIGKDLSNPIPEWAEDAGRGAVPYGIAPTMDTPNPDPGEELPHINTQLFNVLDEVFSATVTRASCTGEGWPVIQVRYPRKMINGVPVMATPAEIDITTAEQLRAVPWKRRRRIDIGRSWWTRTQFCDSAAVHALCLPGVSTADL